MRKIILLLASIFLLLFVHPNYTEAQTDSGWVVEKFISDITINTDTSVDVVETIEVDFNNLQKHGIYRKIPVKYKTEYGNNYNININLLGVTDPNGKALDTKLTTEGDSIKIRIGDPDKTLSGEQTYVINYSVERALKEGEGAAEFYWNATGTEWPVPISQAITTVKSPTDIVDTICFTGRYGADSTDCSHIVDHKTGTFQANNLSSYEGLTLAMKIDPDGIVFPSTIQKTVWFLRDNWLYLIPIVVFLILFTIYWRRGRDRKYKNIFHDNEEFEYVSPFERKTPSFVFHPPKNLSPGEVGVIVDEKVHDRDITAVAIDLARRGYFTVTETEKGLIFKSMDFELISTGKEENDLHEFEKKVLELFFGSTRVKGDKVKLSKMPKNSYKVLPEIKKELYTHLTNEGYFVGNPDTVRKKYMGISLALMLIPIFLFGFIAGSDNIVGIIIATIASAIIIIIFSLFMPARSPKGRKALEKIVGLREYVRVGAWRQKKFEDWGYFEEILPYTIAFGLTHKFINAFKDANIPKPDWYKSSGAFRPLMFSNAMDNFSSSMSSGVKATAPRSSSGSGFGGGGFSGGGFGGGGGGSW